MVGPFRMKTCTDCSSVKLLSEFYFKDKNHTLVQSYCKDCARKRSAKYYGRYGKQQHARRRRVYLEYLSRLDHIKAEGGCVDCGNKDPRVLDFDHVTGVKWKAVSEIARSGYAWKFVEDELRKCVIRCSNCHRIRTYESRKRKALDKHASTC